MMVRVHVLPVFFFQINSTSDKLLIGSFSAASNLTGVLTDTVQVSCLLHKYGALSLWDYASAGFNT